MSGKATVYVKEVIQHNCSRRFLQMDSTKADPSPRSFFEVQVGMLALLWRSLARASLPHFGR